MYQKGDIIVYENSGVCRVIQIGKLEHVQWADKEKLYYTLQPIYFPQVIYVPLDTKAFMRPALSREEAEELIDRIPSIQEEDLEKVSGKADQRRLLEHYDRAFCTHRCEDLLCLMKTVYLKNQRCLNRGKKPGQTDRRYQKRAEELLFGELSVALGLPYEKVEAYIEERLSGRL